MQITGWGYTEAPLYDKDSYLLNNPKRSRQLKLAYVQDRTQSKIGHRTVCKENKTEKICVFNQTSVQKATFVNFFVV